MVADIEVFPGIGRLADRFKGILLDAYGVFWGGNDCGLLPGSQAIMEKLVAQGKVVGILSNSTQLASKEIYKLSRHGLTQGKHFHFLMTSGEIAREMFSSESDSFESAGNKFWLFGGVHPKFSSHEAIFKDTRYSEVSDIDAADFIYISVPHLGGEDQIDPELFREEIGKLKEKNLPVVCPNPDHFAHEGNPPRAVVRQGTIAALYEQMGGEVFYIGKPHREAYAAAMRHFEPHHVVDPREVLMVGDTPETDIRGARRFGMPSALVTETGMMADRISRGGLEGAVKALSSDDLPDYFIGRFIDDL